MRYGLTRSSQSHLSPNISLGVKGWTGLRKWKTSVEAGKWRHRVFQKRFKGSYLQEPVTVTFTNRIWWKWHTTSSRTSLKGDFLSQKWVIRLRSLHTRRLSCSEEAQASHMRPHGKRDPQPGTSYPSSLAEAPDIWVMKLSWTFQPQKMQRE